MRIDSKAPNTPPSQQQVQTQVQTAHEGQQAPVVHPQAQNAALLLHFANHPTPAVNRHGTQPMAAPQNNEERHLFTLVQLARRIQANPDQPF